MIIVSDTSPLNYLVLIGSIEVLPQLFREVVIPLGVSRELDHARTPDPVRKWMQSRPAWLRTETCGPPDPHLLRLGAGEAEAITLAIRLRADHLLIDERAGTKAAIAAGLAPLSLLAVLKHASAAKLLNLRDALGRLQTETNYRMSQRLVDKLLEGEP